MDDAKSKVLPSEWIAVLFRRLRAIYGSRLDSMWAGAKSEDLTAAWASELGRYEGEDIRAALESLRFGFTEWPPTLFQFADLCRDARERRCQSVKVLPDRGVSMPPHVREQLREFIAKHAGS